METVLISDDIHVFFITATSFPDGIAEAHRKLHSLVPFSTSRKYFGLSRPEDRGLIVYRAAAEEFYPGEGAKLNCETLVLHKGNYICSTVHDYLNDLPGIAKVFQELLAYPGLDPQGYCVEWYVSNEDLKCMVRLKD